MPLLDGDHVAFGTVVEGLEILSLIGTKGCPSGVPTSIVEIIDCGVSPTVTVLRVKPVPVDINALR